MGAGSSNSNTNIYDVKRDVWLYAPDLAFGNHFNMDTGDNTNS